MGALFFSLIFIFNFWNDLQFSYQWDGNMMIYLLFLHHFGFLSELLYKI